METTDLLDRWLASRVDDKGAQWLAEQRGKLRDGYTDRTLHITLGLIPRRLGKLDLDLSPAERAEAQAIRPGWDPGRWSVADAGRVLILLETASAGNQDFATRFADLCRTSDVAEAIALYRGLPLYPEPQALEAQAAEGVRTNMRTVFEAVAHCNPYPREVFSETRFNHMVLKALFVDSRLHPIQGLDERANPELARILCDYAHERWAAGRKVSPELWRCVGPHASGEMVEDLARAYSSEHRAEAIGAGLALNACPAGDAARVLESRPELAADIAAGRLDWADVIDLLD